jgi:hypothetical protein
MDPTLDRTFRGHKDAVKYDSFAQSVRSLLNFIGCFVCCTTYRLQACHSRLDSLSSNWCLAHVSFQTVEQDLTTIT